MQNQDVAEFLRFASLFDEVGADVYAYFGGINRDGYQSICNQLKEKSKDKAILFLATNGGDPNAGYRIARALLHTYGAGNFTIMVPTACKSAGTLMCIGASELVIADAGELGPLDIQVNKPDEMFQNSSGLDILQAISYLENAALTSFSKALVHINRGSGVSTKTAAGIADGLIGSLYQPIVSQIDPVRLGEMQRAINIAEKYGERLDSYHSNLKSDALRKLIWEYPAHGFVIDRREAKDLFKKVRRPSPVEQEIGEYFIANLGPYWQNQPIVVNFSAVVAQHMATMLASQQHGDDSTGNSGEDHGTVVAGSDQEVTGAGGQGAEAEPVAEEPAEQHAEQAGS